MLPYWRNCFILVLVFAFFYDGCLVFCQNNSRKDDYLSFLKSFEMEISSIFIKNSPAVVRIEYSDKPGYIQSGKNSARFASGFIIDSNGYILTTLDIVYNTGSVSSLDSLNDMGKIRVFLSDDSCYTGKLVGFDSIFNIALIKIEKDSLPIINLSSNHEIVTGKTVLAITNPYGLANSLSIGFISGQCRGGFKTGQVEQYLQTTIPMNPGDMGAPLLNCEGEAIGIMTAVLVDDTRDMIDKSNYFQPLGISFAIPTTLFKKNISSLIKNGYIKHSWLGIEVQDIAADDFASLGILNNKDKQGILVTHIFPDGPAKMAGIKHDDVITQIGKINIRKISDLQLAISQINVDTEIELTVIRSNQNMKIRLITREMPKYIVNGKNQ